MIVPHCTGVYNRQQLMLYKCPNPNCEKLRSDDGRKCPHCGADYRGSFRGGKHAVSPRELMAGLIKFRCQHGILRDRPCLHCGRSDEECRNYETAVLMGLKELAITVGGLSSAQAWDVAKKLRDQIV